MFSPSMMQRPQNVSSHKFWFFKKRKMNKIKLTIASVASVCVGAFLFLFVTPTGATNILLLGDSFASFIDANDVERQCQGSNVRNIAIGGTLAREWANGLLTENFQSMGFVPDYVWVSIGGNEFLEGLDAGLCGPQEALIQISSNIRQVTNDILQQFPNVRIVMTGYGLPTVPIWDDSCNGRDISMNLNKLFTDFDYPGTTVVPVFDLFGGSLAGSSMVLSDPRYFLDSVHLNAQGYERLFSYGPFANAVGCTNSGGGEGDNENEDGEGEEGNGDEEASEEEGGKDTGGDDEGDENDEEGGDGDGEEEESEYNEDDGEDESSEDEDESEDNDDDGEDESDGDEEESEDDEDDGENESGDDEEEEENGDNEEEDSNEEEDELKDDADFRFKHTSFKNCDWVANRPRVRCERMWKGKHVHSYCPVSCGRRLRRNLRAHNSLQ